MRDYDDIDHIYEPNMTHDQRIAHIREYAKPREDQEEPCIYKTKIVEFITRLMKYHGISYRDALLIVKFMNRYLNKRYLSKNCIRNLQQFADLVIFREDKRDRLKRFLFKLELKYEMQPAAIRFNDPVVVNRDAPRETFV